MSDNTKIDEILVKTLVKRDLLVNVIKNENIGTFRHLRINSRPKPVITEHCFLNIQTKGDLSSLKWFESQHKYWPIGRKTKQFLCKVNYAALNFRDITLDTGKLQVDYSPEDQTLQENIPGMEFSGSDQNGIRVMGLVPSKALATTIVMEDYSLLWPIPEHWSMEEASTVPMAYATAYYALIIRGKLLNKESILIHSGSGAVGQAAINICLSLDCNIFITVGSDTKRQFLLKEYPKLDVNNFASSRDLSFETLIMNATNGRGVDIVLNSLSKEKLQASVRCLAINGRFLEIGKLDLLENNMIDLSNLITNKTFQGIDFCKLLIYKLIPKIARDIKLIHKLISEGINAGTVKPINRTVFDINSYENAFRFISSEEHIGKVIIKIRDEENYKTGYKTIRIHAIPRTVFYPNKSYIIIGGLGGFGLELANWMIERGAMNLILTSRRGPTEPYQYYILKCFEEKGIRVIISKNDALTLQSSKELLKEAQNIGPIGGIFNLALVLKDCLFENMDETTFEKVCAPKSEVTLNLDQLSRKLSPKIDYFVCFSSVTSGRGNAGQSNYGFGNSVMERVCDSRRDNGYHGLAIQWGLVGDVGYVLDNFHDNDIVINGTVPQRMRSCLLTLDDLMKSPFSVCSSFVLADQKVDLYDKKENLLNAVTRIIGVRDIEKLSSNTTLVELGLDSLMAVSVKQTLEKEYNLMMSLEEIRKLTLINLVEITDELQSNTKSVVGTNSDKTTVSSKFDFTIPTESTTHLNDIRTGEPVFIIPPIDNNFDLLREIAIGLNRPAIGFNWTLECKSLKTIEETVKYFLTVINRNYSMNSNIDIIGYSFGGLIGFAMGIELEKQSKTLRKLVLLDSSPLFLKMIVDEHFDYYNHLDKDNINIAKHILFLMQYLSIDYYKAKTMLQTIPKEERLAKVTQIFIDASGINYDPNDISFASKTFYNKVNMVRMYSTDNLILNGDILLIKATEHNISKSVGKTLPNDYGLSEISDRKLNVFRLEGDHKTFISNNAKQVIDHINNFFV